MSTYKDISDDSPWLAEQLLNYEVVYNTVKRLSIKDIRHLCLMMRNYSRESSVNPNLMFPKYGFTAGEFALFHMLLEKEKKDSKRNGQED